MTDPEIRRALERVEQHAQWPDWLDVQNAFNDAATALTDSRTGYAATLRELLEARALLRETHADEWGDDPPNAELAAKVRAFLAEGESA